MELQFPHCTYETISDFNLLCYKWRFAIAEFPVKIKSGNSVIMVPDFFSNCQYINIFWCKLLLSLSHQKHCHLDSQFISLRNGHVDPTATQPKVFQADKDWLTDLEIQGKKQPALPLILPFCRANWWFRLVECVSVLLTLCLVEIPLGNTPTQTAHTLGLTATGVSEGTSLGEKQLGRSWLCLLYMAATVTDPHVGCCNF